MKRHFNAQRALEDFWRFSNPEYAEERPEFGVQYQRLRAQRMDSVFACWLAEECNGQLRVEQYLEEGEDIE